MISIKKCILFSILLQSNSIFSKNSIIILYGCSSSGKTSIASELVRILPGTWKYIASNQFYPTNRNCLHWNAINAAVAEGFNVIVDTHSETFLLNDPETQVLTILLYCSPEKLIEHVNQRNKKSDPKTHRALKRVFQEYCQKYKSVKKSQKHIDTLNIEKLQQSYSFFISQALKQVINKFFSTSQHLAYVDPSLNSYDCLINTGKTSISASAQKIKQELMLKLDSVDQI
jgi:chloramphenicol 3-O-phosphotransferase